MPLVAPTFYLRRDAVQRTAGCDIAGRASEQAPEQVRVNEEPLPHCQVNGQPSQHNELLTETSKLT
ncbi:MAG: hypothetical protein AAFO04_27830 [Cyanobacteria bacterium J06592_8]